MTVIDMKSRAKLDCQDEGDVYRNGEDTMERRMSAAGALHRLVNEMKSEFGARYTFRCLAQEIDRVQREGRREPPR